MPVQTLTLPSSRKRSSKKPLSAILGTCPINGAGWCPYPFSPKQLERHLKRKLEEAATALSHKDMATQEFEKRILSRKSLKQSAR